MNKLGLLTLIFVFSFFTGISDGQESESAKSKDFYRTFEIIDITANGLVLEDNDGNTVRVEKDTEGYKVGYKVRYDSIRNRLRPYRWQDYTVLKITHDNIMLQHLTGETLSVSGNYRDKFKVGDEVRYDSVGKKILPADKSSKWQQYEVIAANSGSITLKNKKGEEITLDMDNNLYLEQKRGIRLYKYKVGDMVRYNAYANKIRKGEIRTYDWQDYEVARVTKNQLELVNEDNEELVLDNTYGIKLKAGDLVKYDRLNNLLKKSRK